MASPMYLTEVIGKILLKHFKKNNVVTEVKNILKRMGSRDDSISSVKWVMSSRKVLLQVGFNPSEVQRFLMVILIVLLWEY